MSSPFRYPVETAQRKHGPQGYAEYSSYRPWLRDEFSFRCVYCLLREQWGRVRGLFDLDHFAPVASAPAQAADYDNLLYSCATCNAAKGDRIIPSPRVVLMSATVRVLEDGSIQTSDPEAARVLEILGLDSPETTEFRMLWIGIVALAGRYDPGLFRRLMGYPAELPDLRRLHPPDGNTRPEGIERSALVLRERGELPETCE